MAVADLHDEAKSHRFAFDTTNSVAGVGVGVVIPTIVDAIKRGNLKCSYVHWSSTWLIRSIVTMVTELGPPSA